MVRDDLRLSLPGYSTTAKRICLGDIPVSFLFSTTYNDLLAHLLHNVRKADPYARPSVLVTY